MCCVEPISELFFTRAWSMNSQTDRREFPRFQIQIPLPLSLTVSGEFQEERCDATALNVSMNGVCCTVDRFLPVFDRVLLTFVLPDACETPYHLVSRCEGIIVRIDPEEEQPGCSEYHVAVYFNNLSQPERNLLRSLIQSYAEA